MTPGMALKGEMKEGKYNSPPEDLSNFGLERWMLTKMKKAVIMVLGSAAMKYMKKLSNEQELMLAMADMMLVLYTAESCLLRTMKLTEQRGLTSVSCRPTCPVSTCTMLFRQ